MTLWNGLVARYCPSLDTNGNGTTTLHNLDGDGNEVGSNDGTLTNMDAATDWVADTANGGLRALSFDGVAKYVVSSLTQTPPVTITGWVKSRSTASTRTVVSLNGVFVNGTVSFRRNNSTTYRAVHQYSSSFNIAQIIDPGLNWFAFALTVNSSDTITAFRAGVLVDSDSGPVSNIPMLNTSIGCQFSGTSGPYRFKDCLVDDICIFNGVKPSAEIATLASQRGYVIPSAGIGRPLINGGLVNHGLINGGLIR